MILVRPKFSDIMDGGKITPNKLSYIELLSCYHLQVVARMWLSSFIMSCFPYYIEVGELVKSFTHTRRIQLVVFAFRYTTIYPTMMIEHMLLKIGPRLESRAFTLAASYQLSLGSGRVDDRNIEIYFIRYSLVCCAISIFLINTSDR